MDTHVKLEQNAALDTISSGARRTSGDGMEQEDTDKNEIKITKNIDIKDKVDRSFAKSRSTDDGCRRKQSNSSSNLPIPGLHTLYRRQTEHQSRSLPPVIPKGKLYLLKPRLIESPTIPEHKKTRPPKFIPFEPYPGATNPIIPTKKTNRILKRNRNNLDINDLVTHVSTMRTQELEPNKIKSDENSKTVEVGSETQKLIEEVEKLKEERDYFQSQLKFQVTVNSELKNLLVASVGEDMQTRVNVLTEDKLQLARALLDTANNLTTHTEQIEFLAGQCEVWRSKFLASSVMVEELARWKADLSYKNSLLSDANRRMLCLSSQVRDMQLDLLKNLKFLAKLKTMKLPSSDVLTITSECLNLSQQLVLHSGVGIPDQVNVNKLETLTEIEKIAVQALETVSQPLMATDEAFRAIVGQAQRPCGIQDINLLQDKEH